MSTDIRTYHFHSKKHDWSTPPELFARLDREFSFTLDVCALAETAKCARYFTPDDDGLSQDWSGDVCWMNPPYGRAIVQWVRKAFEESQRGALVVALLPVRTDTGWWHDYAINGEIEWLRGRINFGGDRKTGHNAPFPSAIVVFRSSSPVSRGPRDTDLPIISRRNDEHRDNS